MADPQGSSHQHHHHAAGRGLAYNNRPPADGFVGRLTYIPAQNPGEIGELQRKRANADESEFNTPSY